MAATGDRAAEGQDLGDAYGEGGGCAKGTFSFITKPDVLKRGRLDLEVGPHHPWQTFSAQRRDTIGVGRLVLAAQLAACGGTQMRN